MWDAEKDDASSFEIRVDAIVREIGERGQLMVSESVPPTPAPAVAPIPAPAPAPSPNPPPAATTASSPSPSTTMQQPTRAASAPSASSSVEQQPMAMRLHNPPASFASPGTSASLMEVSAFMSEQLKAQMAEQRIHDKDQHVEIVRLLEAHRKEIEMQRQDYEAKLEAQRQDYEAKLEVKRQDYEAKLKVQRQEVDRLKAEQTFQARIEALHKAKLLSDEELYKLEDAIFDNLDETVGEDGGVHDGRGYAKMVSLFRLSERVANDATLARQLRHKYL